MLYINHSGKYIEINFNMKIPFVVFMGTAITTVLLIFTSSITSSAGVVSLSSLASSFHLSALPLVFSEPFGVLSLEGWIDMWSNLLSPLLPLS